MGRDEWMCFRWHILNHTMIKPKLFLLCIMLFLSPFIYPSGLKAKTSDCHSFDSSNLPLQDISSNVISDMQISPDGNHLAVAAQGKILLHDVKTLSLEQIIDGNGEQFYSLAWSPDGKSIAGGIHHIFAWDIETGKQTKSFEVVNDNLWVIDLAWSPNGTMLAGIGLSGLHIWDAQSQKQVRLLYAPDSKYSSNVDPDARILWFPNTSNLLITSPLSVSVWDTKNDQKPKEVISRGKVKLYGAALSPDGKILAVVNDLDRIIEFWDTSKWLKSNEIKPYSGNLIDLKWSPDAETLAYGVQAKLGCTLYIWRIEPLATEPKHVGVNPSWVTHVIWTPDNKGVFASLLDGTILKWGIETDELLGKTDVSTDIQKTNKSQ